MRQTVVEKIAQAHMTEGPRRAVRVGDFVSLRPKHVLTHDNTAAVMKKFQAIGAKKFFDPRQPVFALDHDIQNRSEDNLKKYRAIEAFAQAHGIQFYPAGAGIGHQLMCERGYVTPGSLVVASDSHANMYGALGALGTPVVRTDAAAIWATGEFWWQIPPTVQVVLEGELAPGVSGKDVIIALCGLYPEEVLNAAVEFSGRGVRSLSMDARLTIANMSTEWGALAAWFQADEVTSAWLTARRDTAEGGCATSSPTTAEGGCATPSPTTAEGGCATRPDEDAAYAARITLDLGEVSPCISGPDAVQVAAPVAEVEKKKVAIQKAYLLSCTNARREDLEAAAEVVRGRRVSESVKFYLGAASAWVQQEAEKSGAWQTLLNAGAIPLPPGCGPCIGLGTGLLEAGEVGISATNRNFKGRMGSREAQCYLGSPAVVAASAVAGYICGPDSLRDTIGPGVPSSSAARLGQSRPLGMTPRRNVEVFANPAAEAEPVEILPGFPGRISGRLLFLPKDNLNTDGIYAGAYTYREDMTPEMMAAVVFDNYDPDLAKRLAPGDIVVGGQNFGCGSSREQAVTALKAKGIPLVIAASFSQTYLRNAFNNGFLCLEQPDLVARLRSLFVRNLERREKSVLGGVLSVDFARSVVTYACDEYRFPPLGAVPQSLVIAGGVENVVARRLGLGR